MTQAQVSSFVSNVTEVVGFDGTLEKDLSKPDGTLRKLMQADRLRALSWAPQISLRQGLEQAYQSFLNEHARP